MLRWLCVRCAWMVPSLIGITCLTFLLLDLAPLDRARLEVLAEPTALDTRQDREMRVLRLEIRYGLVDERTLERVPVLTRYMRWLGNALRFRLAGPGEDQQQFRARIAAALPVTLLLGFWSLAFAFGAGVPLGIWLGMRADGRADRMASGFLFVAAGLPEVLIATLLLLAFGFLLPWFPSGGLHSDGIAARSWFVQLLDLAWHLALPVAAMSLPPLLLVARFLRESVRRAAATSFAANLRAWGVAPAVVRGRVLRAASAPLATLAGSLLPLLVSGSVVVESVFPLDGLGKLAWHSVGGNDQAMVMALVLIASVATLVSLVLSDLLHRLVDPRVRLSA